MGLSESGSSKSLILACKGWYLEWEELVDKSFANLCFFVVVTCTFLDNKVYGRWSVATRSHSSDPLQQGQLQAIESDFHGREPIYSNYENDAGNSEM